MGAIFYFIKSCPILLKLLHIFYQIPHSKNFKVSTKLNNFDKIKFDSLFDQTLCFITVLKVWGLRYPKLMNFWIIKSTTTKTALYADCLQMLFSIFLVDLYFKFFKNSLFSTICGIAFNKKTLFAFHVSKQTDNVFSYSMCNCTFYYFKIMYSHWLLQFFCRSPVFLKLEFL